MFYFNLLNKAKRTSFDLSMTLFFFVRSAVTSDIKVFTDNPYLGDFFIDKKPVKLDTGQNLIWFFVFFKYCTYIYIKIYTLSIQVILKQITKQIVDIKNFTSYFRRASVLVFLSSINKFFEQQTPIKAESSPQSFSRLIFSPN